MNLEELGAALRAERERRGLSIEDVANTLKIGGRHLRALEDADLSSLPHVAYTRGFIRAYAGFLGLSQAEFDGVLQELAPQENIAPAQAVYMPAEESGSAQYSPYSNETVDVYMDEALAADSLEESYELWQKAQWDGSTGVTQEGDIPWVWLCNVDHLYYVRDGLQIAEQKIHPHGHGWSLVNNVDQWSYVTP